MLCREVTLTYGFDGALHARTVRLAFRPGAYRYARLHAGIERLECDACQRVMYHAHREITPEGDRGWCEYGRPCIIAEDRYASAWSDTPYTVNVCDRCRESGEADAESLHCEDCGRQIDESDGWAGSNWRVPADGDYVCARCWTEEAMRDGLPDLSAADWIDPWALAVDRPHDDLIALGWRKVTRDSARPIDPDKVRALTRWRGSHTRQVLTVAWSGTFSTTHAVYVRRVPPVA